MSVSVGDAVRLVNNAGEMITKSRQLATDLAQLKPDAVGLLRVASNTDPVASISSIVSQASKLRHVALDNMGLIPYSSPARDTVLGVVESTDAIMKHLGPVETLTRRPQHLGSLADDPASTDIVMVNVGRSLSQAQRAERISVDYGSTVAREVGETAEKAVNRLSGNLRALTA